MQARLGVTSETYSLVDHSTESFGKLEWIGRGILKSLFSASLFNDIVCAAPMW